MKTKRIRTRYAPSPTGFLHIGGARTALMSYLFAKHYNGDFVLRIEDTDVSRNIKNGEESQIENLLWLGIIPDESPLKPNSKYGLYRQTEKLERYNKIINSLLEKGLAYKAYDTKEELLKQKEDSARRGIISFRYDPSWLKITENEKKKREQKQAFSVRIKLIKDKFYEWEDIVRGKIKVNTNDIGDFVIKKENGYPTYNLAVVVDDYDMEISHVLRGEEHISNTPKQMAIYESLGWNHPEFGHLTIITNLKGKKLSKRDLSVKQFIEDYKKEFYHPEGIFNFLALLGWTSENAQELMSKKELIANFDPQRLSKSPSKFDINKMRWFSKMKINLMSTKEIIDVLNLKSNYPKEWLDIFINTFKKGAVTFQDFYDNLEIYNVKLINKKKSLNEVTNVFANLIKEQPFTIKNIQDAILKTSEIANVKGKNLFLPLRLDTTYKTSGPELAMAIWLFGKETIYKRLNIDFDK